MVNLRKVIRKAKGGHLPKEFDAAHDLCFVVHDYLAQFIVSGEDAGVFSTSIVLENIHEQELLEAMDDIFGWLDATKKLEDRARLLKTIALPAVLSDLLHCLYEALESSRKAKLNVTYILLRKPIQESLFLIESAVLDGIDFSEKLASDPLKLRPKNAGGIEGHKQRIEAVLTKIGELDRFDAAYLAQLRYDKAEDGFDGICNLAIHLFTEHKAIRTEKLNINFIFSDWGAKLTQWSFLYSRLPYLLVYMLLIIEFIGNELFPTDPEYLGHSKRQVSALVALWRKELTPEYLTPQLEKFASRTAQDLFSHCKEYGFRKPTQRDLIRMAASGAFPGESAVDVKARFNAFASAADLNKEEFRKTQQKK